MSSSLTASASMKLIMEAIRIGEEPARKAGGGRLAACGFEPGHRAQLGRLPLRTTWGRGPTGRHWFRNPAIRVQLPATPLETHGPVVQRPRHLVHTQETMVQLHPGPLSPGYANSAERLGLNPSVCGFDSRLRHLRTCVGWASVSPTDCKSAATGCAGSTPARRTDNMARSSIG